MKKTIIINMILYSVVVCQIQCKTNYKNIVISDKKEKANNKQNLFNIKQDSILFAVIDSFIRENEQIINRNDSIKGIIPTYIELHQRKAIQGNKVFAICQSNFSLKNSSTPPTHIMKIKNRYILMYVEGEKPLKRKDIPTILNTNMNIMIIHETAWFILMYNNSSEYCLLKDIFDDGNNQEEKFR